MDYEEYGRLTGEVVRGTAPDEKLLALLARHVGESLYERFTVAELAAITQVARGIAADLIDAPFINDSGKLTAIAMWGIMTGVISGQTNPE
jgi:hypothetical protein